MSDEAGTLSDYTSDDEIDMIKLQSIKPDQPKTAPEEQMTNKPSGPVQDSQIFTQQLPLIGRIPMGKLSLK